jgi:hypothetical protein
LNFHEGFFDESFKRKSKNSCISNDFTTYFSKPLKNQFRKYASTANYCFLILKNSLTNTPITTTLLLRICNEKNKLLVAMDGIGNEGDYL